jgi:GNAT superfamily N-acetyltransferase
MEKILTDFSPDAMVKAITGNCYAFSPYSHNWKEAEIFTGPGVNWVLSGITFPPCNCAFNTELTPQNADAAIERFIARGQDRNLPLQWYIGPDTRPADMPQRLAAHGFTSNGDSTGMAIDLHNMNETIPFPKGLEIIEVNDDKALQTWCEVLCTGFGTPPQAKPAMFQLFQTERRYQQPEKLYLAVLDGRPVSTSLYFLGEGVVGIYMVATLPEARQKGAAFAVTQHALKEGRKQGYRAGILQASKMGEPVYRRMGFKEYCRVSSWAWIPQKEGAL